MRIAAIELENWGPYRGKHQLALGAEVYAVVASRPGDPESSNWAGKSRLLWAVPFALYGTKPPKCRLEDDWISWGEARGEVVVRFDDGAEVKRSRERGKTTRLEVAHSGGEANGERAQELVDRIVGLSEDDFFASCFFRQKQMARLVRQRPAEFYETLAAWFKLDRLQRCAASAGSRLASVAKREADAHRRVEVSEKLAVERALGASAIDPAEVEALEAVARAIDDRLNEDAAWHVRQMGHAEYEQLAAEAKGLKARLAELDPGRAARRIEELAEPRTAAQADHLIAQRELEQARAGAGGNFDGRCPVACAACPSVAWVKRELAENAELVAEAEKRTNRSAAELAKLAPLMAEAQAGLGEARRLHAQIAALAGRAKLRRQDWEDVEASGPPPGGEDLRERSVAAWELVRQARSRSERAGEAAAAVAKHESDAKAAREELAAAEAEASLLRAAQRVFGRQGAQRAVARAALAQIESDANGALAAAGVDLSLEIRWERDGQAQASHCHACGAAFAPKAKACACGAVRGKQVVEEPEVVLSGESDGAADDLAGVALQLSAAAWLRRSRAAGFSTAIVDEAFGALDAPNRRLMAAHFASMLRQRYGFEQGIVVAHSDDVVGALPGRIEIVSEGGWSRFAPRPNMGAA